MAQFTDGLVMGGDSVCDFVSVVARSAAGWVHSDKPIVFDLRAVAVHQLCCGSLNPTVDGVFFRRTNASYTV